MNAVLQHLSRIPATLPPPQPWIPHGTPPARQRASQAADAWCACCALPALLLSYMGLFDWRSRQRWVLRACCASLELHAAPCIHRRCRLAGRCLPAPQPPARSSSSRWAAAWEACSVPTQLCWVAACSEATLQHPRA